MFIYITVTIHQVKNKIHTYNNSNNNNNKQPALLILTYSSHKIIYLVCTPCLLIKLIRFALSPVHQAG